jgi:iron complex outermembrane receptor protein
MLRHAIGLLSTRGYKVSSGFAAGAAMVAMLASAPLAAADSANELGEVVVTANKLNAQKVLDIPVSIQAISGDALQGAGVSGIMDIAGDIPLI